MPARLATIAALALALALVGAAPVAGHATVDRVTGVDTVLAVAMPDDFPVGSLMRAECDFVQRVERPDGSSTETMVCELSDEPVMIPLFQGSPPSTAFRLQGGPCVWASDYWFAKDGSTVYASSFQYVVTPSGRIRATASFPVEPLICE